MNKIYKVVWSKVKHCYVVTSELAKRNSKGCGARSLRMAAVSMGVAAALLGGFGTSVAEAGQYVNGNNIYVGDDLEWNGSTKVVTVTADTILNDTTHGMHAFGNISYNYGGDLGKLHVIADSDNKTNTVEGGQVVTYHDAPIRIIQQYPSAMELCELG